MRVGLVCPYDWSRPGGVQSHVRGLARHLERRGHRVRILAPGSPCPGVVTVGRCRRVRWFGTQIDLSLASPREVRRVLSRERFDLLHFHTVWNPLVPLQILAASRCARVATFHDTPGTDGPVARILMPLASRLLARFLDGMVAVSPVTAAYLPRRALLIPNGVDTADFHPQRVQPFPEFRDGRLNLLFLGRLEERKGLPVLLEAYGRLKRRRPDLRLLVAGDGPLRRSLERGPLPPDVHFLGPVEEADKPRWYATCDLFCSPATRAESFGIVLVEAMAGGRPAVGAANPGYRTVLPPDLLAEPGSAASLEAVLGRLVDDPDERGHWGRWGLQEARRYDWGTVGEALEEAYSGALERCARRGRRIGFPR